MLEEPMIRVLIFVVWVIIALLILSVVPKILSKKYNECRQDVAVTSGCLLMFIVSIITILLLIALL